MQISNMSIKNFRNYKSKEITFCKNYNILYGDNAQGKTNILEAIFLCSSGRSHRTSKDSELIRFSEDMYSVNLNVENQHLNKNIVIRYEENSKKIIKINDICIKKIGNLMGNLICVMFSPEDLNIIKQGPSERRRLIDITISQLKPSYFYDLQLYNKILSQRNALLKEIRDNKTLSNTLEVWNDKVIEAGSRIIKVRFEFINKIKKFAQQVHYKLTDNQEKLFFEYVPSFVLKDEDINTIKSEFNSYINKNIYRDLNSGNSVIGPHRDDINFIINGKNAKQFGSQGQQRTAVLSIKLSMIALIKDETGQNPVLLLDDVMSELDKKRQEYLIKSIEELQSIITCTGREEIMFNLEDTNKEIKYFNVTNQNARN